MSGALPRPFIHAPYHLECGDILHVVRVHRLLNDARNRRKAELSVQKMFHGHFVGSIQHHGERAADAKSAVSEIETWKAITCRCVKIETRRPGEIENRKRWGRPSLGIRA